MPMLTTLTIRLPVCPFHCAAPHTLGKVGHPVEYGVDLGNHVLAVHDDGSPFRCAEGHVQDRPVLRDVDLLAAEHGVDPLTQAGFLGQLHEQLERFVGDAVLGVIQVEAPPPRRSNARRAGVVRKERSRRCSSRHLLVVIFEGLPCAALVSALTLTFALVMVIFPRTIPYTQHRHGSPHPKRCWSESHR